MPIFRAESALLQTNKNHLVKFKRKFSPTPGSEPWSLILRASICPMQTDHWARLLVSYSLISCNLRMALVLPVLMEGNTYWYYFTLQVLCQGHIWRIFIAPLSSRFSTFSIKSVTSYSNSYPVVFMRIIDINSKVNLLKS